MGFIHFTPSQFQDVNNQLIYSLPERLGSGIVRINDFSSGLRLMYINLKPTRPITLVSDTIDWTFGFSFNLTGHSAIRSSEHRKCVSAEAGSSVHFSYPGIVRLNEEIGISHKSKISILFNSSVLFDLANEDEGPFLPFLKGFQNQIPAIDQGKTVAEEKRALNQLVACPYSGKTRDLFQSVGKKLHHLTL